MDRGGGVRDAETSGVNQLRAPAGGAGKAWEIALPTAVTLLVAWQLFVPPVLSVANEGDFQKLAGRVCIGTEHGVDHFDYITLRWFVSNEGCSHWPFHTSAELVLRAALSLDRLAGLFPAFDSRWMGALHTLLFLANCLWAQRLLRSARLWTSRVLQTAFLVVICNAVYIPMFNTFYFDPIALAMIIGALAGTGAMLLLDEVKSKTLLATALALALVAASKGQHTPLALACVPAFWVARGRKMFPPVWARLAGSLVVVAGAAVALGTTPPSQEGQVTYNALFFRILPSVPNPADYLAESRLPARYLSAVGTHSYVPGSPNGTFEQQKAFARMFGLKDLALLYLRHPDRAWYMMNINLDEASVDRVRMKIGEREYRLGNYERRTGKPPESVSHFFGMWPALKHGVIGGYPRRYFAYILAVIAAAWLLAPRWPGMRWFLGIVTAMLVLSFAVPLADGLDGGRHLQMFNYLLDLVVCGVAALTAERIAQRRALSRRDGISG
jgi:hypothetical protein